MVLPLWLGLVRLAAFRECRRVVRLPAEHRSCSVNVWLPPGRWSGLFSSLLNDLFFVSSVGSDRAGGGSVTRHVSGGSMRLERLEISGFKSFSDRSELAFDKGVTAIVGPNGCGKSNVADAITWVLGEQSAKSLRGEKMEDVIFNGSDARKPGAAAEVRLRLSGLPAPANLADVAATPLHEFQAGSGEAHAGNGA